MAQSKRQPNTHLHTHGHNPSEDTKASGLAESAISYSAFPEPPSSIPPTPIRSVFGSPGPSFTNIHSPVSSRHGSHRLLTGSAPSTSNRFSRSTFDRDSARALTTQQGKQDSDVYSVSGSNISPYDWHEGASSIDVDATEDRLLPTSFITSLLQENAGPRAANRTSYSSDAFSGISEMTYPPRNPFTDSLRDSSAMPPHSSSRGQSPRSPLSRPVGGRPRSSSASRGKQRGSRGKGNQSSVQPGSTARFNSIPDHRQNVTRSISILSQNTLIAEQSEWDKPGSGKLAVYKEVEETEDDSQPDTQTNSSAGFANFEANLARQRQRPVDDVDPRNRDSAVHSTRSTAPSFVSRISTLGRRAFAWRRKPLPPLPTIPHSALGAERTRSTAEEQAPLPDLVIRANHLHGLLEKGYYPHQSIISSHPTKSEEFNPSFDDTPTTSPLRRLNEFRKPSSRKSRALTWLRAYRAWVILGVFIIIAIIAISSAVGVTAQRNKVHKTSSCPANLAGVSCNLNATCVCTSSSFSSCDNPIGQAILDVIPIMNKVFSTNISNSTVSTSLWVAQGRFQGSSCVEQVDMIDVGPGLDVERQRNRTQWAQSALLWTLTQTQDSDSVADLQKIVQKADWSHLPTPDGPTTSAGSDFITVVAGYNYDFASQTITPIPANFVTSGQPQSEQVSRVDDQVLSTLDRMYSYAVASSEQREHALLQYWTNTLHQGEDNLESFKAIFSASPIVLPFDATSQVILNSFNASSFPPPIACYPGLNGEQQTLVNAVEGKTFGLPQANATVGLDTSCFPTHPVYGILNLLRLRLPFADSGGNVSGQGVVLNPDVTPRAILAVGESLSTLPGSINATLDLEAATDPRNYGTTTYANHIILQYLSSMSTNTANAIISHVMDAASSSAPLPPNPGNEPFLFPLDSIPSLEVAVFGSIEASDTGSYVSSFTTPSGSLFFGSSDGSAFRTWAIGRGGRIAWTENATSPEVVYDASFSDQIFNETWTAASLGISTNAPNVGLSNITDSFSANQRFST